MAMTVTFNFEEFSKLAKPITLLVVDDEAKVRHMLRQKLDQYFGGFVEAADGWSGLLAFGQCQKPCLVIADFAMPGMNGAEMIRKIHEQKPDQRVVILTAMETHQEVKRAFYGNRFVIVIPKKKVGAHPNEDNGDFWNPLFLFLADIDNAKEMLTRGK